MEWANWETINDLKELVADKVRVPPDQLRLYYAAKVLEDGAFHFRSAGIFQKSNDHRSHAL